METSPATVPTLRDLGFIEPGDAATLIDVKPLTLSNWRAARKGPPFTKIHGNKIVYPLEGLKKWLTERTVRPVATATLASAGTRAPRRDRK
jgi:hypothetical protein